METNSNKGQEYLLKLSLAVYRVTDQFPDQDPLHSLIREKALWVLESLTLLCLDGNPGLLSFNLEEKSALYKGAIADIEVLKQYLKTAQAQEWVKKENCAVLLREYQALQDNALESEAKFKDRIPKDPASVKASVPFSEPAQDQDPAEPGTEYEFVAGMPGTIPLDFDEENELKPEPEGIVEAKDVPGGKEDSNTNTKENPNTKEHGQKEVKLAHLKSVRQKKILKILNQNDKAQLGQMKKFFPEVTKRTLRRDLNKLLSMDLVQRNGEGKTTFYRLRPNVRLR